MEILTRNQSLEQRIDAMRKVLAVTKDSLLRKIYKSHILFLESEKEESNGKQTII